MRQSLRLFKTLLGCSRSSCLWAYLMTEPGNSSLYTVSDLVLCYTTRTEHLPCQGCRHPHQGHAISAAVLLPGAIWSLAACVPSLTSWQAVPVDITKTILYYLPSNIYKGWPSENENFSCCQLFSELFGQSRRKIRTGRWGQIFGPPLIFTFWRNFYLGEWKNNNISCTFLKSSAPSVQNRPKYGRRFVRTLHFLFGPFGLLRLNNTGRVLSIHEWGGHASPLWDCDCHNVQSPELEFQTPTMMVQARHLRTLHANWVGVHGKELSAVEERKLGSQVQCTGACAQHLHGSWVLYSWDSRGNVSKQIQDAYECIHQSMERSVDGMKLHREKYSGDFIPYNLTELF